ncbi:chaperonin groEL [Vibrio phage Aphrodite1]|uniref:Heat shock protein 60 family chaperone n=1 Tax=Vibrio phage Aphrodite1 TaxID=2070057 RepID=A0A2I7QHR7_9CAUD|nr:chaperonin groEL [Vibrio phage Aphrodite1]AUR80941.1 heat shock protein 60 family chaperone [Vibrio phage Aphrodite1]
MLYLTKETKRIRTEAVMEVTSAVTSTMGPEGKVVVCDKNGIPFPTKDGVTVAKALRFEDPSKDMFATMVAECCLRTDKICGDGTTTTAFLLNKIYSRFNHLISFNTKKLLREYTQELVGYLNELSTKVDVESDLLRQVMMTTSNNDERIVNKVLEIYRDNPHLPELLFKEANDDQDQVQASHGCSWPGGFASPEFSTLGNGAPEVFMENDGYRPILVSGRIDGLDNEEAVSKFIEYTREYVEKGGTYLIMGRSIESVTEQTLKTFNSKCGRVAYKAVVLRAAGSSGVSIMNDIATVLDAKMHTQLVEDHPEYRVPKDYPIARITSAAVSFAGSTLTHKASLDKAITNVQNELKELNVDQRHSALGKIIEHRLRILSGGTVTLYVGGITESDIRERIGRFEDVARVCVSALSNGVLQGCGYSLILAGKKLVAKHPECEIVEGLWSVLKSQSEYLMLTEYKDGMIYTNLATGEQGTEPGKLGVWDAALATTTALEAATSMAITLMDSETLILNSRLSEVRF